VFDWRVGGAGVCCFEGEKGGTLREEEGEEGEVGDFGGGGRGRKKERRRWRMGKFGVSIAKA
jgi:hypothetical protein